MRSKDGHRLLLLLLAMGCSSARSPQPAIPPVVAPSLPVPAPGSPTSWTFRLTPGTVAYRITRTGIVENRSDSASRQETSANSSYETITLQQSGDTIGFTVTVDTFSTTVQGLISPHQQASPLPFQLSGFLTPDTLRFSSDSLADQCNPVRTLLITDLHNLLPQFPESLSRSSSWRDSTNMVGCQGSVPVRSRVRHSFTVLGETSYENRPVLVIQRADTIQAEGEGAQQQHRLLLSINGAGNAVYYLDIGSGRVVHLTVTQDLILTITASGRPNYFRQNARQDFALVR
jgi:hypothetical protein